MTQTTSGVKRKRLFVAKVKKARKMSSFDLREIARDVRRAEWGTTKTIGRTKWARKPTERVLNERYRAARRPISSFHAENYSIGELQAIAAGRVPEAWTFTMQRTDVPMEARKMAFAELLRRAGRR